jgi:hypothetical protein
MKKVSLRVALLVLATLSLQAAWGAPAYANQVLRAISCCATMCGDTRTSATSAADCCQVVDDGAGLQGTASAEKGVQHPTLAASNALRAEFAEPAMPWLALHRTTARTSLATRIFLETRSLRL